MLWRPRLYERGCIGMKISIKDYSITLVSGMAVALYSFVILKLVLVNYGEQALEFFSILKRYQVFLVPVMLLGFGVTLPKYLAMRKVSGHIVFFSVFAVGVMFLLILAAFFLVWQEYYLAVLLSLPALAAGFLYSVARGLNRFVVGAWINILFLVFLPTIVFVLVNNVTSYVLAYFFASILFFVAAIYAIRRKILEIKFSESIPQLIFLKTSFARVPGDFLNQGILMLPVQIYIYMGDLTAAAHLSVALSFVVACAIPLKPLSTILLVKVAMTELDPGRNKLAMFYYCIAGIVLALLYRCFTWVINAFYFDDELFLQTLNMLTPLVFFYSLYVLSRSYVDALFSGPVLTYINFAALLLGGAMYGLLRVEPGVLACFSYGCAAVAVVYLVLVKKHA